ncbi:MAG: hypothetical protein KDD33_11110 [Bdellovibrionales bacterium]|nr:hypothetical protein [Bdellovibrionales bacterium]
MNLKNKVSIDLMANIPSTVHKLIDQIGEFIQYWGFKEIHGRIWALIFLSPEPIDANFMMEELNASKALVSISLKDLLHYNVIHEVEKKEPGTKKYVINPHIDEVIADVLLNREAKMLVHIRSSCELARRSGHSKKSLGLVDSHRLKQLEDMIISADHLLQTLLQFKQSVNFAELSKSLNVPVAPDHGN